MEIEPLALFHVWLAQAQAQGLHSEAETRYLSLPAAKRIE